ncbi:MAG: SHOCT domain-containing protein [Trebonia sp.]
MIMRRRRPLLRAAVVGGGAYMAGKSAANRSADRADQDARISNLEAQQQQAAPVPEPRAEQASGDSDVLGQLTKLVQMHDSGALTDDEFSAAKARLLG